MQQATQTYLQYNPSACTSCQACLNNCPKGCIYFDPLFIMSDECILCGQCLPECPEGVGVVLAESSKLLGKEWFWFVLPQETNTDSKEESKGESSQEPSTKPSTDNPTTPTNPPTISPEIDSIYAPPQAKYKQA